MLCIDNTGTDVYFNLATEEHLLKNSREAFFMLWQNEPSVVVGKHQDVFAEVNIDFVNENGIKIARRFSGGGAVYHDQGNLNLTFIETCYPADFAVFSRRIVRMLAAWGVKTSQDERRAIFIDGLKLSGSAQSIYKDRVLYHATLLFSSDLKRLGASLESQPGQKRPKPKRSVSVKSVKSPVTTLAGHLPFPMEIDEAKAFIMNYFIHQNPGNRLFSISEEDRRNIETLRNTKYAAEKWIYDAEFLKK